MTSHAVSYRFARRAASGTCTCSCSWGRLRTLRGAPAEHLRPGPSCLPSGCPARPRTWPPPPPSLLADRTSVTALCFQRQMRRKAFYFPSTNIMQPMFVEFFPAAHWEHYLGEKLAGDSSRPGLARIAALLFDWGCSGVVSARFWEPYRQTTVT